MTTGNVSVVGYRQLIEPPERGDCGDPGCETVAINVGVEIDALRTGADPADAYGEPGKGLLLVASYSTSAEERIYIRVCAACDERHLRAWLADR